MIHLRSIWLAYATLAAVIALGCAKTGRAETLSGQTPIRPAMVKVDFTSDSITPATVEGDAGVAGRAVTIDWRHAARRARQT
jgi:hypothetical protein